MPRSVRRASARTAARAVADEQKKKREDKERSASSEEYATHRSDNRRTATVAQVHVQLVWEALPNFPSRRGTRPPSTLLRTFHCYSFQVVLALNFFLFSVLYELLSVARTWPAMATKTAASSPSSLE